MIKRLTIKVPTYIRLAKSIKGKKYRLNLNNFNTRKGKGYNSVKIKFTEIVGELLDLDIQRGLKINKIETLEITMITGDNRRRDRDNVVSAIRKFTQDALVSLEIMQDDTDEYIGIYTDGPMQYIKGEYYAIVNIIYT